MSNMTRGIPMEYEPLRLNRFIAEFPTDLGIETFKVHEFKQPNVTIGAVEVPYMNETNYVSGKYKFDAVDMVLIDTIGTSTASQVMDWFRLHAEALTGRMGYKAGSARDIILKALDPGGFEVQKWTLEQCIITSIDFGRFSHTDDGLKLITLTVQPYRSILNY
jgi:hypothetical protein